MYSKVKKSALDIVFALLLLFLSLPLIIILLLVISFITKQFPVIVQERKSSLSGRKIRMIKIRTIKGTVPELEVVNGSGGILYRRDLKKYVPPFCRWLRKSGLDEIMQLINVLKGEMSLVGPRPLTISDLKIMKEYEPEIYRRRERLKSKPGITGYWQIFGDRSRGLENLVASDEYYENNKSFLLDLKLLLSTVVLVMTAKHSDSIIDSQMIDVRKSKNVVSELRELWID